MPVKEEKKKKAGPLLLLFGLGGAAAAVFFTLRAKAAPETTNLSGTVTDMVTGRPVPNVLVTMDGVETYTNSLGQYSFTDLVEGAYQVTFEKEAYAVEEYTEVVITEGDNRLNVQLTRVSLPVIDSGGVSTGGSHRRLSRFANILYATYLKRVGDANEVFVAFSVDDGGNWSAWQVTSPSSPGPGAKGSPSVAVDSNGKLTLVYAYGGDIYYDVLSGTSWLGPQQVNDPDSDMARGGPEVVIDSQDNPHVFYLSDRGRGLGSWGRCYVRHAENPPIWSKTDFISTGTGGGGSVAPGIFAIAINSLDQLELVWSYGVNGGPGAGWIARTIYRGAKEDQILSTNTPVYGAPVDIAVDQNDGIIIFWGSVLQYYGASLGLEESVGSAGMPVSLSVTADNGIYLIGSLTGAPSYPSNHNLFVTRRGSGSGGILHPAEFLTDVEDDNNNPCLLWARYPGDAIISDYAVMWKREMADQILFGSPDFFALLPGV